MTRLGWSILVAIVLVAGLFASMVSFRRGDSPVVDQSLPPAEQDDSGRLVVPVKGVARAAIQDTWGQARDAGARAHQGTDIPAAGGTPVLAATGGRIDKLFESRAGGRTVYIRSPDGRWTYYYAHLAGYAPGLHEGQAIRAGQTIAFVGDSGNAGAGNTHLHFGVTRTTQGAGWWEGEAVNPYPMLAGSDAGG